MTKILLIISVVFLTSALFVQSIYVYQQTAEQSVIIEEEPVEESTGDKNNKDVKDKHFSFHSNASWKTDLAVAHSDFTRALNFSKGFVQTPYTPPDFA